MARYSKDNPFRPPGRQIPAWATYIQHRSPQWKVHSDRGKAKNAVNHNKSYPSKRGGVIYHLVNGQWEIWEYTEGPGAEGALRSRECVECSGAVWEEEDYLCPDCRKKL